jgi:HD-GYP domain-containing protein (c-di-GMP phosphodiesterase class II)
VADAADAILSNRPYRAGADLEAVEEALSNGAGSQFDPAVVEAFLRIDREAWARIRAVYPDEGPRVTKAA